MKKINILKELTIEEKVRWTSGRNLWQFLGNERLGIKPLRCADGPHGVRTYNTSELINEQILREQLNESTMFPVAAAMASTFNTKLIQKVGETIGHESNMYDVDVLLAPGVNLKRSPLGGRNFEYYSEDPYLTMRMGTAFVDGVQSTGVGATIKHFALNEQETQRRFIDTIIDQRTLHELYLYPFEEIIKQSNPYMVMSSYNKINGHYGAESKELLTDILRKKWNYDGAVISDWTSVQDKVKSIKNGMNLEMPFESEFYDFVHDAIETGELTEEEVNMSIAPLIKFRERTLLNKNKGKKTSLKDNHNIAYQVSKEAVVLLENDGILPFNNVSKLGVIGEFAEKPRVNGGGSATLKAYKMEIPLDELKEEFTIDYSKGYEEENTTEALLEEVEKVCKNNEIILYFTGTTEELESEGRERPHMMIPDGHKEVFEVIQKSGKIVVVILSNGSSLDIRNLKSANAIIEGWLLGGANGKAIVDILQGRVNPSGRLAETFPIQIHHTPHYGAYPSHTNTVNYTEDMLRVGYRFYDTHKYPVQYPFGYGLSYTNFEYSDLKLSNSELTDGEELVISFNVKNVGDIDGYEVPQVYVRDVESYYPRPFKELKGFDKVFVKSGDTVSVSITLREKDFAIYCVDFEEFRVETGLFEILVGKNVNQIELSESVNFVSEKPIRKALDENEPFNNFEIYSPEIATFIEDTYGSLMWFDKEQPMKRILFRIQRDHKLSDKEFEILKEKVYK